VENWLKEGLLYVRPELQEEKQLLGKSLWLMFSAWPSQKKVLKLTSVKMMDKEIKQMFWSVFFPYFTEEGWQHFNELKFEKKILSN
jgi:hypothetical protein